MKNHLKVETSVTEDDALITSQMIAARNVIETRTSENSQRMVVLVATTFELTLPWWWWPDGYIPIPRGPVVSVESITYVDTAGVTQTLDAAAYALLATDGRIYEAYGQTWPSVRYASEDRATVRFVAGVAAPFTADATTDALTILGRSFTVGDRVRVMNSGGALPAPLVVNRDYFVLAAGKLSLTSGGASIDITTPGSGTHFIASDLTAFETGRNAIKLLTGFWYFNREAVLVTGMNPIELPMAVDALVASIHA